MTALIRFRSRVICAAVILLANSARAADLWTNLSNNGLWVDPNNWSELAPPAKGEDAVNNFNVPIVFTSYSLSSPYENYTDVNSFSTVGPFSMTGGALVGTQPNMASPVSIGGLFTWSGGTLMNIDVTANGGMDIPAGFAGAELDFSTMTNPEGDMSTVGVDGGGIVGFEAATFVNAGTLTAVHGYFDAPGIPPDSTFSNTGTFNVNDPGGEYGVDGTGFVISNSGTINVVSGTFLVGAVSAFNNSGTVHVQSGTLQIQTKTGTATGGQYLVDAGAVLSFDGGTETLDAASSIAGAGAVSFDAGTINFYGTYNVTGPTLIDGGASVRFFNGNTSIESALTLTGGALGFSGNFDIGGPFTWSEGAILSTTVTADGGINISGNSQLSLDAVLINPLGETASVGVSGDPIIGFDYLGMFENAGMLTATNGQFVGEGMPMAAGTFVNSGIFYVDAPGGTFSLLSNLTFSNSGTVVVENGTLEIGNSYTFATDGKFLVDAGAVLNYGGTADLDAASSICGAGSVIFNYAIANVDGTYHVTGSTVFNDADVNFSGSFKGNSLTINSGIITFEPSSEKVEMASLMIGANGALDLTNNSMVIDYGLGNTSPLEAILAYLQSGYNNGLWNGDGIRSSAASNNSAFGIGYADGIAPAAAGQILLAYTLYGDANLDGVVNLTDLLDLLNSYGDSGTDWVQGDFNYDGTVNLTDLLLLLNNYGQSDGTQATLGETVPEPAAGGLLFFALTAILPRRRRRKE